MPIQEISQQPLAQQQHGEHGQQIGNGNWQSQEMAQDHSLQKKDGRGAEQWMDPDKRLRYQQKCQEHRDEPAFRFQGLDAVPEQPGCRQAKSKDQAATPAQGLPSLLDKISPILAYPIG